MNTKITLLRTAALIMLLFLFPGIKQLHAQTTLSAGDIAFTGYNSSNGSGAYTNDFTFIILRNGGVANNTQIIFTDNGWNSSLTTPALGSNVNDGTITWTATAAVPQFTQVTIKTVNNGTAISSCSNGSAVLTAGTFLLSGSGDQVLAYQGAGTTFLAGIQMNAEGGGLGANASTLAGWDDLTGGTSPYAYSGNRSAIPPGLTTGVNAVMAVTGSGPFTEFDDGKYDCTGSSGAASVTALAASINDRTNWAANLINTSPVTLPPGCTFSIGSPASITAQPANASACAGSGTSFAVSANNPTGWTWEISTNGGSSYSTLSITGVYSVNSTTGTTGSTTLTISDVSGLNGYMYRAIATGTPSATSNAATLTVIAPVSISSQPGNATICSGGGTTFSVTASNVASYQWQVSTNSGGSYSNLSNGAPYSGVTTNTLTISGATTGLNGNYYRVVMNANSPCTAANSNAGILTVNSAPAITTNPSNSSICTGNNTSFTGAASNASSYQWEVSTNGGSSYSTVSNGGVYSNATTTTLNITGATVGMNGYLYRLVATGSCSPTATSTAATLTVSAPGTWLGGTSSAWSNTANWSCGTLPTATTNVTIPGGTNFQPQVDITTAICNDLTINSGGSLSFATGSYILEVKGTITNNGTFNGGGGKVKMSGTTQSVPGITYQDLEISGSGTKLLTGNATVNGTFTLTSGHLQLDANNLTLGNSATISGGSVNAHVITSGTGQMRIQNIGPGGKTGSVLFPIGTADVSYTPVQIQNTGTIDVFGARVIDGVYKSYDAAGTPNGAIQTSFNVNKTWLVTEGTANGSVATLTFTWYDADEQSGFVHSNCFASHWMNGNWNTVFPAASAGTSAPYAKSLANVTSFSPFAVGSTGSILPLDLLSFTGKATKNGTALNWVTANEKNVAGFDIERSADGRQYERVANMPARANNSTTETAYSYTDAAAPSGTSYYRLKMNDLDGTFNYSNTVIVSYTGRNAYAFTVYPNPVNGNDLNVQLNAAAASDVAVQITDMTGHVLYNGSLKAGEAILPVNIKSLPAGIYQVHINGDAINATARFTKL